MSEVKEKLLQLKTALRREADPTVMTALPEWTKVLTQVELILSNAIQEYEANNMEVRHYCSLWVRVAEAKGLPCTDLSGTIDSYVEIWTDNQKKGKTRTIWKDLNPCFLQEFYLYVTFSVGSIIHC